MKIKRLLVIFGIFMIMALLFNVNNAYATSKKETTVNTAEEYKTAMADDTYDVVYLGADITLTNEDTPSLYEININEVSHRVLDLNGHELIQRDYVRAKVSFIGDNKKFEVKNSNAYDKGRMVMHSNFCTVYNESQWSTQNEIIFTRIQYENENTGSYVLYKGNDEAKEVTFRVDCVTFYYPNNSPLNDDLKLKITSLTVFTKNQTGPVGFYNDENQKHISDVIEDWQDIYIEEQRWNDDRDTTWARDVYLSNGQYDKKLEIIEHKTYDVWANGKRFFEGGLTKACGEGTATFDPETATLTLNNATIENVYEWKPYYLACIYSTIPSINIKLVGANVISPIDDNSDAIDVPAECSVNIFGGGTLTISGGYYGTYLGEGGGTESNLTIDGVTISILNSGAAGLWVNNNIDIKNSKVNILKDVGTYSGIVSNDY